jgi:hypothetical protein
VLNCSSYWIKHGSTSPGTRLVQTTSLQSLALLTYTLHGHKRPLWRSGHINPDEGRSRKHRMAPGASGDGKHLAVSLTNELLFPAHRLAVTLNGSSPR